MLDIPIGMKSAAEGDDESLEAGDDYSEAKAAAAERLAAALGISSEDIDAKELCAAVKEIVELESE
jgi:hypothetical protein